ncbi:DinB family protein [Nonomuraea sp. NPDC059194]|uniref:DinB family protein n=1 Tax=Nonomuraea sp. NPDC059194 TaxID=3346764 RepID=UPI0036C68A0E
MTETRMSTPFVAGEREMLDAWLDWHRETLAIKCAGLTDEQLRERSAAPSTLSLLGLVRHLADVERAWFRRILMGEDAPRLHSTLERPDDVFDAVDTMSGEQAFAAWRGEIAYAREVSAGLPLDTIGKGLRHGNEVSLRWIMVHMIEEYARHNGHADLLRERIDGVTGE